MHHTKCGRATKPGQAQLKDFDQPRIETHVGVAKADLRFADVLVIERQPPASQPPRVETFSFKSRDFRSLKEEAMTTQMIADANNALMYYGEILEIRRPGLEQTAQVRRVRLIYEGGELKPESINDVANALNEVRGEVMGVEVQFQ